jgi:hypothetical protein
MYNSNAVIVFVMIMSRNDIEFDSSFSLQSAATSQTLVGKVKAVERLKFYKEAKLVDINICI